MNQWRHSSRSLSSKGDDGASRSSSLNERSGVAVATTGTGSSRAKNSGSNASCAASVSSAGSKSANKASSSTTNMPPLHRSSFSCRAGLVTAGRGANNMTSAGSSILAKQMSMRKVKGILRSSSMSEDSAETVDDVACQKGNNSGKLQQNKLYPSSNHSSSTASLSSSSSAGGCGSQAGVGHRRGGRRRPRRVHHHVGFGSVEVRHYARTIGDNPSVSSGPPLAIDWIYDANVDRYTIDDYERMQAKVRRRSESALAIPRLIREDLLRNEWGIAQRDMAAAVRDVVKTKNQRRQSIHASTTGWDKVDGAMQRTRLAFLKTMGIRASVHDSTVQAIALERQHLSSIEQQADLPLGYDFSSDDGGCAGSNAGDEIAVVVDPTADGFDYAQYYTQYALSLAPSDTLKQLASPSPPPPPPQPSDLATVTTKNSNDMEFTDISYSSSPRKCSKDTTSVTTPTVSSRMKDASVVLSTTPSSKRRNMNSKHPKRVTSATAAAMDRILSTSKQPSDKPSLGRPPRAAVSAAAAGLAVVATRTPREEFFLGLVENKMVEEVAFTNHYGDDDDDNETIMSEITNSTGLERPMWAATVSP